MESAFEQGKKKKESEHKGFDVRFADELACGLRSGNTSHEQFLRAVGESRIVAKKVHDRKSKQEDSEFAKRARDNHEKSVKIELGAILGKKKIAAPASESIFGKKKRKRDDDSEPEKEEEKELRELGEKWDEARKKTGGGD